MANFTVPLHCSDTSAPDENVFVYRLYGKPFLMKEAYKSDIFKIKETQVFQPKLNNSRITAQQGWFTAHRFSKQSNKHVPLEKNSRLGNNLTCFIIPSDKKEEFLEILNKFGINEKTLFPGLEGICKYLNWTHHV